MRDILNWQRQFVNTFRRSLRKNLFGTHKMRETINLEMGPFVNFPKRIFVCEREAGNLHHKSNLLPYAIGRHLSKIGKECRLNLCELLVIFLKMFCFSWPTTTGGNKFDRRPFLRRKGSQRISFFVFPKPDYSWVFRQKGAEHAIFISLR